MGGYQKIYDQEILESSERRRRLILIMAGSAQEVSSVAMSGYAAKISR